MSRSVRRAARGGVAAVLVALGLGVAGPLPYAQAYACTPVTQDVCGPTALALTAEYEALGTASAGVGATTSSAIAGTSATASGVTGLTFGSVASTTAGAAAVGVGGWYAGDLIVGDGEGTAAGGLDLGTQGPQGWANGDYTVNSTWYRYSIPVGRYPLGSTLLSVDVSGPAVGEAGSITWTVTAPPVSEGYWTYFGWTLRADDGSWGGGSGGGWQQMANGSWTRKESITAAKSAKGYSVTFTNVMTGEIITWYPEGHPKRPQSPSPGEGTVTQHLECIGSDGQTVTVEQAIEVNVAAAGSYLVPDLICPPGTVASGFEATWTPSTPGAGSQSVVPFTQTEPWVRSIVTDYPSCLTQTCRLQLSSITDGSAASCGPAATGCPDWYVEAERDTSYECWWGPYEVELQYCSVYRDPGNVLPNATIGPDGLLVNLAWPALALDSGPVLRAIDRLTERYSEDYCAVLGEAVRGAAPTVSVPDTVIVCEGLGVAKALEFIQASAGTGADGLAVQVLANGADGPEPLTLNPECDAIAQDGSCLDEGAPPATEPEPEPGGAGARIPPPPSCLDTEAGNILRDSMPDQYHHMATIYGDWAAEFELIASRYQLNLTDSARVWNAVKIPHRGPHPAEYHMWVLDNMILADATANGDAEVFRSLFEAWIVDVVKADPTIVRVAYWKCYR